MKQFTKRNTDPVYSACGRGQYAKLFDPTLSSPFRCGTFEKASMMNGTIVPTEVHLKRCPVEPNTSCGQKDDVDEGMVKFLSGETDGVLVRTKKLDLELEPYRYEQV